MTDKAKSTSEAFLGTATEGSTARTEAPTLTAGRETDARVMALVFKREIKWSRGEPYYITPDNGDGWVSESTVPRFSLALVKAFYVAEQFKYGWSFTRYSTEREFSVTLYRSRSDNQGVTATANTLPLAICRAAVLSQTEEGK